MLAIPAIDLIDGKCVRLVQGAFDQPTVFADDPVSTALRWQEMGAERIHVVDLNGSRLGAPQELRTIEKIVASVRVPIQVGGGVRTLSIARTLLRIGVDRVIIGTSAACDEGFAKIVFSELGEQVALALDARDGLVAVNGWEETTELPAREFALRMQSDGAKRVIYTDISRDGMLRGANIPAIRAMAEALDIPVIASGGVSTLEDVRNLAGLESLGVEAAIIGKALYTGAVDLAEAIAAGRG